MNVRIEEYDENSFTLHSGRSSKFDETIRSLWNEANRQNLFRYKLDISKTRIVEGHQNYVLQLNTDRLHERRSPEGVNAMHIPFNPQLFNFTKVKQQEILFELKNTNSTQIDQDLVLINVSPLEYCHVLLVPQIQRSLPQVFTEQASSMALEFLLLTALPGWKLGFNSLCALASVNHLHLHSWYIHHPLAIEKKPALKLSDDLYIIKDEITKALAFQLVTCSIEKMKKNVYLAAEYLQSNKIAHNIFWSRSMSFDLQTETIKAFIWPRKSILGNKLSSEERIVFNVAVAELAGHVPMYAPELFDELSEIDINKRLSDQMLSDEDFKSIIDDLLTILSHN